MGTPDNHSGRVIRFHEVKRLVPLSRTTLWRMERAGRFPRRIQIGSNAVAWHEQEVLDWIAAQPRGLGCLQGHSDHRQRPDRDS